MPDEDDKEVKSVKDSLQRRFCQEQILGKSDAIIELYEKISRISQCDANVLIFGESGTGKELVARAIHYLSSRADKPFIPVNCGAIPETLFENELFGHIKGAFTDARIQTNGLVKEADGGTLFLDEIGVISPYIQVKLLRLLQDKEYKPLGESRPRKANIRILTATNKDLKRLIRDGLFREDLYYRLDIVSIRTPPLRERREDIKILADHFVDKYSKVYGKPIEMLSKNVIRKFTSYSWPGNVRELENMIQHLIVMSPTPKIDTGTIKIYSASQEPGNTDHETFNTVKKRVIDSFEKSYLTQILSEHNGDVASAARSSGKSRTALWNLIKKHKLSPQQFRH